MVKVSCSSLLWWRALTTVQKICGVKGCFPMGPPCCRIEATELENNDTLHLI